MWSWDRWFINQDFQSELLKGPFVLIELTAGYLVPPACFRNVPQFFQLLNCRLIKNSIIDLFGMIFRGNPSFILIDRIVSARELA